MTRTVIRWHIHFRDREYAASIDDPILGIVDAITADEAIAFADLGRPAETYWAIPARYVPGPTQIVRLGPVCKVSTCPCYQRHGQTIQMYGKPPFHGGCDCTVSEVG